MQHANLSGLRCWWGAGVQANCIHLSASCALRLIDSEDIRIVPRGSVEVKGKGRMNTFWIKGYAPTVVRGRTASFVDVSMVDVTRTP
eukprot:1175680-Prorocentrum_minimum.AAC.1